MDFVSFIYLVIVVINLVGFVTNVFAYIEGNTPGEAALGLSLAHFLLVVGFSGLLITG